MTSDRTMSLRCVRRHGWLGTALEALLASLIVAAMAPLAWAHGDGDEVFASEVGPYDVAVRKAVHEEQGDDGVLEYTVILHDKAKRRPVFADRASVQVSAETSTETVEPIEAEAFGHQYYVRVPMGSIEAGGPWTMEVAIEGELGEARFTHELPVQQTNRDVGLIYIIGMILLIIGGIIYWVIGRSGAQAPSAFGGNGSVPNSMGDTTESAAYGESNSPDVLHDISEDIPHNSSNPRRSPHFWKDHR